MIAADTSSIIAFLQGDEGDDVTLLANAIEDCQLVIPPPVITEILSDPKLPKGIANVLVALPQPELLPDYWARAGRTRSTLIKKKLKARLADTMIAQVCIDHKLPLVTRDKDFRHFAKYCELRLITQ